MLIPQNHVCAGAWCFRSKFRDTAKDNYWIGLMQGHRGLGYRWENCRIGMNRVAPSESRWLKDRFRKIEPDFDGKCVFTHYSNHEGFVDYDCNAEEWIYRPSHRPGWMRNMGPIYALCEKDSTQMRWGERCLNQ